MKWALPLHMERANPNKGDQIMTLSRVAGQILHYLIRRPDSKDTAQGILEWWLLDQAIQMRIDLAREGLNELVEKGYVLETRSDHSAALYYLNHGKLNEIETILKSETQPQ